MNSIQNNLHYAEHVELREKISTLIETKEWVQANDILAGLETSLGFNKEHIAKCANLAEELQDYITEASVLSRLSTVFAPEHNANNHSYENVKVINIAPVLFGRSCIYALKIDCIVLGKRFAIFEKIFASHRVHQAKNELKIYQSKVFESVLMPKLFGMLHHGNIISNYYEWVESQQICIKGRIRSLVERVINPSGYYLSAYKREHQLAYKALDSLWRNQSDCIILDQPNEKNEVLNGVTKRLDMSSFLSDKKIAQFMLDFADDEYATFMSKVLLFVKNNRNMIEVALNEMPIIIMHGDIHMKNMLGKSNLDVFFIDWEGYVLSRVGDGFFRFYHFRPFFLFRIHVRKLAYQHKVNYKSLVLSIVVYELLWVMPKSKTISFKKLNNILNYYYPNGIVQ